MTLILNSSESFSFVKSVRETIASNCMLCSGDKVLVAVSGGADSMALLYVLFFLSYDYDISLGIAHLNHNLREEASRHDALFVELAANRLNIPFYCISADVLKVKKRLNLSIEEASRKIRYAFFKKLMIEQSFSKVALAHHMDDNAELILMFMLRGSGLTGLSGISPIRENYFIRPFIRSRKYQILQFLSNEGIQHIEDESNNDLKFTRNNVRHRLMPLLVEAFNPSVVNNLNRTAILLTDENEWMDQIAKREYKKTLISCNHNKLSLSVTVFNKLHIAVRRRIIRKALLILLGSLKRITFAHIEAAVRLAMSDLGTKQISLPACVQIIKIYGELHIKIAKMERLDVPYSPESSIFSFDILDKTKLPLTIEDNQYRFKFSIIKPSLLPLWNNVDKNVAFFDLNFLEFPISVRYVVAGDRLNPLGMKGTQKVKKYFGNKKTPLSERANTFVVVDNGNIIWLVAHTICNYAKVTNATKDVFMIEFCLLKTQ